jgi:phosphoribosylanthranilate isomerase
MRGSTWIKICGVTLPGDIDLLQSAGADAVGLNFIPRSKRRVDVQRARELSELARGRLERVGVVADLDECEILELVGLVEFDTIQLHGNEPNGLLERLGSLAYKAVGVGSAKDVEAAASVPGERILVDTKVGELVGGTGATFDWSLVSGLCRARAVIVAGGLRPDNVAAAVEQLHPFGIDAASGVEPAGRPGEKSEELVRQFVQAVRRSEAV